ncbi:hypothetical protein DXG03_006530 [Asterophora parasitica]|uniref:FAD/NAD(P)-binding domain-containing protein n=1 Tax=Asterophora parasitica TaxID=117018 RepID=A0A9P7FZL0_9AGAR|nr:hypothetical protein DXG03_006530 [Asterophora parasitica]
MYVKTVLLTAVSAAVVVSASSFQVPLSASFGDEPIDDTDTYTFKWPINRVAIIGAGPSGLLNFREFTKAGFDVHLFERDHNPGGNWQYTDAVPDVAPVPNADISVGDFVPSLPPKGARLPYEEVYTGRTSDELLRRHRGPKPIWRTLHSNAPAVRNECCVTGRC